MPEGISLHRIEPFRAIAAGPAVARIWSDANEGADALSFAKGTFPKHVAWPGFHLIMAAFDDLPVGFVYGYASRPGQWWHDQVRPALEAADEGAWLDNVFELAEVAVVPAMQHRGIGAHLVDFFLEDVNQKVILAVEANNASARKIYEQRGFHNILADFCYEGFPDDRIVIMGREPGKEER